MSFLRISRRRVVLLVALGLVAFLFSQWRAAIERNRSIPDEPFLIAGNLHYVGHTGIASFLITGSEGHVLIDGGFPEHGPLIQASIESLGYDIRDVRILLNSHAHSDHAGGLRYLQEVSGAELWVSEGDAEVMGSGGRGDLALGSARHLWHLGALRFAPPRIDHTFRDGAVITLGDIELTAHVTPGHTRGCTTWVFPVTVDDEERTAANICSLTLFPFVPLAREPYPGSTNDWEESFARLKALSPDVFLGSHNGWFDLDGKRAAMLGNPAAPSPFLDPDGFRRYVERAEAVFRSRLEPEG